MYNKKLNLTLQSVTLCAGAQAAPATLAGEANVIQIGDKVTDAELKTIEECLTVALPEAYRATLRDYPFPSESFGAESMLLNSAESVIEFNTEGAEIDGVVSPIFIGSDLGEEWYFLDASRTDSPVFVYQLETGEHQVLDTTLERFLDRIRAVGEEIEADEKAEEERRLNKKWWEFWI